MKKIALAFLLSAIYFCLNAETERPNVIIINLDDLGAGWLAPYAKNLKEADLDKEATDLFLKSGGNKDFNMDDCLKLVADGTPFIDSMSSQGMVFNRCFASSNLCAPSRMGLMTGKYQERWGVCDLSSAISSGTKEANIPLLASYFKDAGYKCAAVGKWHISRHDESSFKKALQAQKKAPKSEPKFTLVRGKKIPIDDKYEGDRLSAWSSCAEGEWPTDLGFDYYFGYNLHDSRFYCAANLWENKTRVPQRPEGEFLTDLFNSKVYSYMEDCLKEKKPFLIYYAPMTMHGRLDPAPERFAVKTPMTRVALHVEHMRSIDEAVKNIYDLLKKYGQENNTVLAICADNGSPYIIPPANAPYRGGKGQGWVGGSRVPLIIYAPKAKGGYSDALVSLLDIFPTAMDYAGIEIPDGLDGESLKPIIDGERNESVRKNFYTDGLHAITWYPNFDWGNVKLKGQDAPHCPMFAFNISADGKLALLISSTKPDYYPNAMGGIPAKESLYDISLDPQQRSDLSDKAPETLAEMKGELGAWLRELGRPLDYFETKNKTSAFAELLEKTRVEK